MSGAPGADPDSDTALAHRMADVAGGIALSFFGQDPSYGDKDDGSPVSEADVAVERALLDILGAERPGDGVLAEESGARGPAGRRRWVIDPIDGTRSYLAGGRAWGTHIALEVDGLLAVAVLTRPTERRRWWAVRGGGAYVSDDTDPRSARRLAVSTTSSLRAARVGGLVDPGSPGAAALAHHAVWVEDEVSVIAALVEGRVDAVLDDGGKLWDQAPAALLVREAGGFFQDKHGGQRLDLGWGLYGTPLLREQLLDALTVAT